MIPAIYSAIKYKKIQRKSIEFNPDIEVPE